MPQPVTSVTGFAMTGGFTRGAVRNRRADRGVRPYGCINGVIAMPVTDVTGVAIRPLGPLA